MAFEGFQIRPPGLVSGADLSASTVAFKFVKLSADNTVILTSGTSDIPIGVIQMPTPTAALGQPVIVCSFGITKVQAGESMVAGDRVACNASGQAVDVEEGTDTTIYSVGQVLEVLGGTTAGNFVTAVINCHNPHRGA